MTDNEDKKDDENKTDEETPEEQEETKTDETNVDAIAGEGLEPKETDTEPPEDTLNEQCAQIRDEVLEMTDEIKALEESAEHLETLKEVFPDDKEIVRIQEQTEGKIGEIKQAARDRIVDLKRCDLGGDKTREENPDEHNTME